ncbi:MAG: dihydrolipoyl dehydrogenase, partial [Rhizobiales bacterium]|nr:dihydrolipoyl dehydrogenase [Hyphomicrobiales bacterium]
MPESFDIAVVGGGPGGYVGAIRASQLGMKVALVERENLGGICLNWGCIPTKALLRASEINHLLHTLDAYGFAADNIRFDFAKVVKRSRAVAGQLSGGVKHLMKKNKVTVFDGHAKLAGPGKLTVTKDGKPVAELEAKHILLATGARARVLPGMEPDGRLIWSYREAMTPTALPKKLIVMGSGAIGAEFASFYLNMGAEVMLIEVMDRILPVEDAEISAFVHKAFVKQGMKILTNARVQGLRRAADSVTAIIETDGKVQEITADRLISAVGIVGNVEDLGLEGTKVQVERTHVVTDAMGQTGEPGIYAIGDLTGAPWLAHKASHEAVICVEAIAGLHPHAMDVLNIPGCTYCRPQVASVG